MSDQGLLFLILASTLTLFIWGRFSFDLVAMSALLAATLLSLIPANEAFSGFGHPAIITVATVLIISKALQNSGIIDYVSRSFLKISQQPIFLIAALTILGALLSGFMNNVGALALLMPVSLQMAAQAKISPALILMPLSFGTILGGLTTMIGTPPNIIIATYRQEISGTAFSLFDFSPVGAATAFIGVIFVSTIGWRLIPKARSGKTTPEDLFEISDYIVEARVKDESSVIGQCAPQLESSKDEDCEIVGILRGQQHIMGKRPIENLQIQAKDILIIQTDPGALQKFLENHQLELVGEASLRESDLKSADISVIEAVIAPGSRLERKTFQGLRLRSRYGIALLGISRQGKAFKKRLNHVILRAGDILLFQGETVNLNDTLNRIGCLPLAARGLKIGTHRNTYGPVLIFIAAIGLTACGATSPHVAFSLAIILLILTNMLSLREAYESVDWPIIVLLAAMIPLGRALETTGATASISQGILGLSPGISPLLILTLIMIVTMMLSDIMNNVATAVVMAPIAANLADRIAVNPDPFLMGVAIASSCAFLTPIGHQNNILVMGPGGYKFSDYWRLGLPLEILILFISIPMIILIWPFTL